MDSFLTSAVRRLIHLFISSGMGYNDLTVAYTISHCRCHKVFSSKTVYLHAHHIFPIATFCYKIFYDEGEYKMLFIIKRDTISTLQ